MARTKTAELGLNYWSHLVQAHMWGWNGHVARRNQGDLTRIVADWKSKRSRNPGRPRENWLWNTPIEERLRQHGEQWQAAAANCEAWKRKGSEWATAEHVRRKCQTQSKWSTNSQLEVQSKTTKTVSIPPHFTVSGKS